ncbi:MAG: hypothetical protein LRY71_14115 [Bacillaceae bacterium]|nr:hypothetical protein [Bacillaceae bacterium]
MKKKMFFVLTVFVVFVTFSYAQASKHNNFELTDVSFDIDEDLQLLRYDVTIKNNTDTTMRSENGFHIIVKPNKKLAYLMREGLNDNDMRIYSTGGPGFINPQSEHTFRVEYVIKDGVSSTQVSQVALDSTLFLHDGEKKII